MDCNSIVARISEILGLFGKGRVVIGENTELVGELAMDSLQVMLLVVAIEDEFNISVPINALARVKTVLDVAVQVQKCIGGDV